MYYTDVFAGAAGMIDTLLVAANFLFLFIVLGVHIFYWLKIKKVAVITFQQKLFTISIPMLLYILWYMAENAFYIISSYPFGKLLWPCEPGMVFFLFVNLYIESNLIRKELADNGAGKPNPDDAVNMEDELPTIESLSSIYFLTEREREIFQQLALGHGNAEIADDLNISIYTVKRHLNNIFKKTNVKSRFELINMLMKH